MRSATQLLERGAFHGKAWRPIIDQLGYDPRMFGPGGMGLDWSQQMGGPPGGTPYPPGQGPGSTPGAAGKDGEDPAGGDFFSAALDKIRSSAVTGYAANQRAYDEGLASLKGRFFDPTNQYSEASQLALADGIARKRAVNAGAASGQLFSGSMLNAQDVVTDATGRARHDSQMRFDDMAGDLLRTKLGGDSDIRARVDDAEFDWAAMIAGDPMNTEIPPKPGAGPTKRIHPTKTKSHKAAGLRRLSGNTYIGPNGVKWHRTKSGFFARGAG